MLTQPRVSRFPGKAPHVKVGPPPLLPQWPRSLTIHKDTVSVQGKVLQLGTIFSQPQELQIDGNSVQSPSQWWKGTQGVHPSVVAMGDRPRRAKGMNKGILNSTLLLGPVQKNFLQWYKHLYLQYQNTVIISSFVVEHLKYASMGEELNVSFYLV